ncbi:MAG: phospho-sugar mutase, partial [Nocardioidaceae bacterium]
QGAGPEDTVVVGYDARHLSDVFAEDTAAVLAGAGLRAVLLPRPLPTPVLAYAVRSLHCVAGVMVTASHNPRQDNGYKVYTGDGSQIVAPVDAAVAAHIEAVGSLSTIARSDAWSRLDEDVVEDYVRDVAALVNPAGPRDLVVAYTPLHGVGGDTVARVLREAGFAAPHVAAQQAAPDPDFPTVAFPNPEEPGAMDLVTELAAQVGADLALANDPDADRCAVSVPGPHGWRNLTGDEVGALLADHALRTGVEGVYASSVVSSSLLGRLAAAHGQPHQVTLTGFKWIGRVDGLAYGYEEALGYCVAPALVRDKDGVSALLKLVEVAALLRVQGRTLVDRLDDLARAHGLHATDQLSVRVQDPAVIAGLMDRLRSRPPAELGGLRVEQVDDLADGGDGLPPTDGLRYRLADHARVLVRPSGTEPKLKCYLEVVVPVEAGDDGGVDAARIVALQRLDAVRKDLAALTGLTVR